MAEKAASERINIKWIPKSCEGSNIETQSAMRQRNESCRTAVSIGVFVSIKAKNACWRHELAPA
jgi:hypothetical protein